MSNETQETKKNPAKTIGILLILAGVLSLGASTIAFGDIGLSFGATGVVAILSGIGFLKSNK